MMRLGPTVSKSWKRLQWLYQYQSRVKQPGNSSTQSRKIRKMPRTLASALVLTATSMICRTFLRLATKSYTVEGLPRIMEALREGNMERGDKGKGMSVKGISRQHEKAGEPETRRRGIVTSESNVLVTAGIKLIAVCNHNSVVDDPVVCRCC